MSLVLLFQILKNHDPGGTCRDTCTGYPIPGYFFAAKLSFKPTVLLNTIPLVELSLSRQK